MWGGANSWGVSKEEAGHCKTKPGPRLAAHRSPHPGPSPSLPSSTYDPLQLGSLLSPVTVPSDPLGWLTVAAGAPASSQSRGSSSYFQAVMTGAGGGAKATCKSPVRAACMAQCLQFSSTGMQ
jgi:hypothetical protein